MFTRALRSTFVILSIFSIACRGLAGEPVPEHPRIRFPADIAVLEAHLGTVVDIDGPMTITDLYALGRRGRLGLAVPGRLVQVTNGMAPVEKADPGQVATLVLDDGSDREHPEPVPYLIVEQAGDPVGGPSTARPPRVGDRVLGLAGRLEREGDRWVLQPTETPRIAVANPRPLAPPSVGGTVRVASFNVLNYFETLGARGASNAAELERQRQKLLSALVAVEADVLALIEVENAEGTAEALVGALAETSGQSWRTVPAPEGGLGDNAIRVALAYRSDRLTSIGTAKTVPEPVFTTRYPLAQTFAIGAGAAAERFTVAVAHLKSKGSCDRAVGPDTDQRDGQGCWNDLRTRQAHRLVSWVEALQASSGDSDVLLVGDLNAYGAEDPIKALVAGGLVDTGLTNMEAAERYSYVYRGRSGTLDYALATPALAARVTGTAIWHINADEAPILDYNTETNPASLFRPDPFRSSDHDPVIVALAF